MGGGATDGPAIIPSTAWQYAGPFLRYQNILPGTRTWTGSVLLLIKGTASSTAAQALGSPAWQGAWVGGDLSAGASSAGPAPSLMIDDNLENVPDPQAAAAGVAAKLGGLSVGEHHRSDEPGNSGSTATQPPTLLDVCQGWQFWRFELQFELGVQQRPVTYAVQWTGGASDRFTFWLPGAAQNFHSAYYSCNGFSADTKPDSPEMSDPRYLWRDLLSMHSTCPMHVLIGGGDQLYNDGVWNVAAMKEWTKLDHRSEKLASPWSEAMSRDTTAFYLCNYINNFMLEDVRLAFASIPSIMMWDDHDIWDGYGSYPAPQQACEVFKGLFSVAKRMYLLFQQHTTPEFNQQKREMFGDNEYHYMKSLGPEVALYGIDMRSGRTKENIMPAATYPVLEQAAMALPAAVQHLIVMSGVPLVFPRLPLAEQVLEGVAFLSKGSRMIRKMARNTGLLDPSMGTQPEILDDLVDGWAAVIHTEERLQFIHMLQRLVAAKGYRVSVLSGDAHVGGVGRLYSHPKMDDFSDDPHYMPQVISSAIMNGPPPPTVINMMMTTNYAKKVDDHTREKMVRTFKEKHPKSDKLLGQRNWCDISLMVPPSCAPMNPEDPQFGALRFSMRFEDPLNRLGHAEEIYDVCVPRLRTGRVTAAPVNPPEVVSGQPAGAPPVQLAAPFTQTLV